jgi:hypothetical protein
MKLPALANFFFAAFTCSVFATAQIPDRIIYAGKEYSLHTNPMDLYFSKHPKKKPRDEIMFTALCRGYVATFEFQKEKLILKDIEIEIPVEKKNGKFSSEWKSFLADIAPKDSPLNIDWFTGILVLPFGEEVDYVHMGYGSTYSNYILLEIQSGKLTGKKELNYKQYESFKAKQFEAYKKTDAYKKQVQKIRKENDSQESIDSFLRSYVLDYTSKFLDTGK